MKLAILLVCALLQAPSDKPEPSFEVSSVKPSDPNSNGGFYGFQLSGVEIKNGTLKGMIETAYDARQFQIIGGPGWIETDRYDVLTKLSPEDEKTLPPAGPERNTQLRLRMRAVLAERFQLKIHMETREQLVYSLVIGKNGSKMKEVDPSLGSYGISSNCGVMKGTRTKISNLAIVLSRELRHPVIDHTNLTGLYDFEMAYAPETGCGSPQANAGSTTTEAAPLERASVFTAIQEQLGLKLESTKGPVQVIVIDRVEKPDPN